jgi:hypothetical protein
LVIGFDVWGVAWAVAEWREQMKVRVPALQNRFSGLRAKSTRFMPQRSLPVEQAT